MSKSLGNLYTLDDLAARGHTPVETRYVLVGAHYRRPLNFTLDSLKDAKAALARLAKFEHALAQAAGNPAAIGYNYLLETAGEGVFGPAWASLRDDLNTPEALGHLFTGIKSLKPSTLSADEAKVQWLAFHRLLAAFGLTLPELAEESAAEIPSEVAALAAERWQARVSKDWARSDLLRTELLALGWLVKDGKEGYTLEQT